MHTSFKRVYSYNSNIGCWQSRLPCFSNHIIFQESVLIICAYKVWGQSISLLFFGGAKQAVTYEVFYTSTWLYSKTSVWLRYQSWYFYYCPFNIHSDIFSVRKLSVNYYWHVIWTFPLFCTDARLSQCIRMKKLS